MPALIECVPNISEGRRLDVVNEIVEAVKRTPGLKWLDQTSDPDHNRSVLTFLGEPTVLKQALETLYTEVSKHIDLQKHEGGHPRMGAVDVVPFIPIADCTMADCVALAKEVGQLVAEKFNVPVLLYEEAATAPNRKNLA